MTLNMLQSQINGIQFSVIHKLSVYFNVFNCELYLKNIYMYRAHEFKYSGCSLANVHIIYIKVCMNWHIV